MNGDSTRDSHYDVEFRRIVRNETPTRPEPIGPYMRWPLGLALALISGQVIAAGLNAIAAGLLLANGHSVLVTDGELLRNFVLMSTAAVALTAAGLGVRARWFDALLVALAVEVVQVLARAYFVFRDVPAKLGPYVGLLWATAALVALAVRSSRAYCTRRRTKILAS